MPTPPANAQLPLFHAVVFLNHHRAKVVRFGRRNPQDLQLHSHQYVMRQHASGVHSKQEFFGVICDALDGVTQVLITGRQQQLADFHSYIDQHRPQNAKNIAGYELVGHPSEHELVVIARKYFAQRDMMHNTPAPRVQHSPTSLPGYGHP